jgi:hypothetical protein
MRPNYRQITAAGHFSYCVKIYTSFYRRLANEYQENIDFFMLCHEFIERGLHYDDRPDAAANFKRRKYDIDLTEMDEWERIETNSGSVGGWQAKKLSMREIFNAIFYVLTGLSVVV